MKKSRVSIAPTTSPGSYTATGVSYRTFFDRFEKFELSEIPEQFNSDKDKPRHLSARSAGKTVEIFSTENGHVLATYHQYR